MGPINAQCEISIAGNLLVKKDVISHCGSWWVTLMIIIGLLPMHFIAIGKDRVFNMYVQALYWLNIKLATLGLHSIVQIAKLDQWVG